MKKPTKSGAGRAPDTENTKYARDDQENTKYAKEAENTKYARDRDNTKYAKDADNTKYARDENTKYAGRSGRAGSATSALIRRTAVDTAVEEALMSATAAVDRVHPGISTEARAHLVATLLDKFGGDLLEAHLDVIASSEGRG
jgi:hypothetical protein